MRKNETKRKIMLILTIIMVAINLNGCGEKYKKDDIKGGWINDGMGIAFTDGEYALVSPLLGSLETGTFKIEGDILNLESNRSILRKGKASSKFKIKIKDYKLYMKDEDGEIPFYKLYENEDGEIQLDKVSEDVFEERMKMNR